ncbi:hypothetical protein EU546_01255 [Candidatus Thorarchaeota archaeon]|nr:MAG: hypothetical protein EU546_01255 [Candidatus Thorarchaeota archaeon]
MGFECAPDYPRGFISLLSHTYGERVHMRGLCIRSHAILVALALLLIGFQPVNAEPFLEDTFQTGPYIDEVVFKVISNHDRRVLALQNGDIDLDTELLDPVHIPQLEADPDIATYSALRNGYGHLTINCDWYPLNISAFRRAFAFAFDKTRVRSDVMQNMSVLHDSLVPVVNPWCIEDELTPHYYEAHPEIGNAILDELGFMVDEETGFRTMPDGSPLQIRVGFASSSPEIAGGVAQIGADALASLHVDSYATPTDYNEERWQYCEMVFYASNFYDYDIDWLADEYWSENANESTDSNYCMFRNSTFDSWRNQLLLGTTPEEIHEAAAEMQRILHYNVPRLVVYVNEYVQAYRIDKFEGHVEDLRSYISGTWTLRNMHRSDGAMGGTVGVGLSNRPNTFNFYLKNSHSTQCILEEIYCSLYDRGPDVNPVPDLATDMYIQTHLDNPSVPEGHTRFIVDILQNATWSDGTPLTAEDVAFTFNYALESATYGNLASASLMDLVAAYAPSYHRVVLEFGTESYWHFSRFVYTPIIPKHVFNDEIGYEGWEEWNPILDSAEPSVWCGPFVFTDFELGEYYEISWNPLFHYRANRSYTSTTDPGPVDFTVEPGTLLGLTTAVSAASLAVIVIFTYLSYAERRRQQNEP